MAESKLNDSLSHCDCPSFTELLKGVMTATSTQLGFQLSPVTQSELSVPHSAPVKQEPLLARQNNAYGVDVNQQNCNHGTNYTDVVMERSASDGYSWRKYGQKQVKSSQSSRSYYRCTICNCHAKKKVQRCDHSGSVIDIVYMGHHNHDPPQKKCARSRRFVSSGGLAVGSDIVDPSVQKLDGSDSSIFWTDHRQLSLSTPESEQLSASSCDGNAGIEEQKGDEPEPKQLMGPVLNNSYETAGAKIGENHGVELKPKKRMKERGIAYSAPVLKTVKEPQIVVHAAGDVGVSSDGYRWRKYGQKMVKGNSHPRSYYRCTSAGCPVRKHVERTTDDTTAIITTYEGKHDHDRPVPKKRHSAPSPALVVAAATTSPMDDVHCKEAETLPNQNLSTKWSSDIEGDWTSEKALEHGDETALESARTLLSIGIELGRC